jgi:Na+/H+-dicarboxylate symporter
MTKSSGPASGISLSDTIYDGVFTKLFTSNIFGSFVSANFAAVVFFAIFFGVALAKVYERKKKQGKDTNSVMDLFKELDAVFLILINWIISVTPFAVFSLIVKAVGSQDDLKEAFTNVGFLVVATIIAMLAHYLLVHWGLFALITKRNPIGYMKHLIPAQTMAFACASSAATIPVTLRSVFATGMVPDAIGRFVVPLGATVNMDGGAIYFPCACIWLAILNGIEPNAGHYILLVFISTIGSAGTAPVPSASLVLIITAYNTVFNTTGTPEGFSYILAIDWFMDRLRTTLNVTGDAVVCGMVAALTPLEEEETMARALDVEGSGSSSEEVECDKDEA